MTKRGWKTKNRRVNQEQRRQGASPVAEGAPVVAERKVKEQGPAILPLLLTVSQVCTLLNLSRSTLFRLEKESPLPGRVNLGGKVMYHRQIIEEWLLTIAKGEKFEQE